MPRNLSDFLLGEHGADYAFWMDKLLKEKNHARNIVSWQFWWWLNGGLNGAGPRWCDVQILGTLFGHAFTHLWHAFFRDPFGHAFLTCIFPGPCSKPKTCILPGKMHVFWDLTLSTRPKIYKLQKTCIFPRKNAYFGQNGLNPGLWHAFVWDPLPGQKHAFYLMKCMFSVWSRSWKNACHKMCVIWHVISGPQGGVVSLAVSLLVGRIFGISLGWWLVLSKQWRQYNRDYPTATP